VAPNSVSIAEAYFC
jgi:diamine N-acetyltransferase